MSSSSHSVLVEDLRQEIQDTGKNLRDLLEDARSGSEDVSSVVEQLRTEVQQTGRTTGEMIQSAFESSDSSEQDFLEELQQDLQETGTDLKQALKDRKN